MENQNDISYEIIFLIKKNFKKIKPKKIPKIPPPQKKKIILISFTKIIINIKKI